jgi:peptidyl-tRNA hydrolase
MNHNNFDHSYIDYEDYPYTREWFDTGIKKIILSISDDTTVLEKIMHLIQENNILYSLPIREDGFICIGLEPLPESIIRPFLTLE